MLNITQQIRYTDKPVISLVALGLLRLHVHVHVCPHGNIKPLCCMIEVTFLPMYQLYYNVMHVCGCIVSTYIVCMQV